MDVVAMETDLNQTALLAVTMETMQKNLNDFFLVVSAILAFAMQMGFSLMETGLVRSKHATTILMKCTLDAFIGSVAYWLLGYALAHGEGNDFMGWTGFALVGVDPSRLSYWFYQAIFANTASTITSGAVAERLHLPAFFIYSFCLTGVMYPIASRWVWFHDGWLKQHGFIDYGGSGVVHMIGGVCALVAALYVGPRTLPPHSKKKGPSVFRGHSMTLTGIGAFLLMFGMLGYNMSSQLKVTRPGDGPVIALSAVNTLIAGSAGSFAALILGRTTPTGKFRWSYMTMLNGSIAGMVSACAGCNAMPVWGAYITGTGAGLTFFALRTLLHRCAVDDALDSFAVHFGGGFFGMLTAPILIHRGVLLTGDTHSLQVLAFQVAGILVLIAWSAVFCLILFGVLKASKILRVKTEVEVYGMDVVKQREPAYPSEAWDIWDYPPDNGFLHWLRVTRPSRQQQQPVERAYTVDLSSVTSAANFRHLGSPLPAQNLNFAHWILKDQLQKCVHLLARDKCNGVSREIC